MCVPEVFGRPGSYISMFEKTIPLGNLYFIFPISMFLEVDFSITEITLVSTAKIKAFLVEYKKIPKMKTAIKKLINKTNSIFFIKIVVLNT
jgi:hypothetical protein